MVDNLEAISTASSEISESLREQILGKGHGRRKTNRPTKVTVSQDILRDYEVIPSKEHSISAHRVHDVRSAGDNRNHGSKDTSYHSAVTNPRSDSFEVIHNTSEIKDHSFSIISMKAGDNHRYSTIETQTVAIQTVSTGDSGLECRCWGDGVCTCCQCKPSKEEYVYNKSKRNSKSSPLQQLDETSDPDPTTIENLTDTSSQTEQVKRNHHNHCTCNCRCWHDYDSISDQFSDSDDSYTTDFLDLPYQNNEEYLKLLRELEKKLLARNRERVRRTMMEFEKKSRQNQNLDKPVYDYSDDGASILRKLGPRSHAKPVCCKCGRNRRVDSDILQNEKRWDDIDIVESVIASNEGSCQSTPRRERSVRKSHWQLDPRSGEWIKVSAFHQSRPPRGDHVKSEHPKMSPHGNLCKNECCCRQKKRR